MNILLWALQGLLAFWNITGGIFSIINHDKIKGGVWGGDLSKNAWIVLGVLQILFAVGLILPGVLGAFPKITPISAAYLGANSLFGCALFAQYVGFPGMLWGLIPAIVCALIAYGRIALV